MHREGDWPHTRGVSSRILASIRSLVRVETSTSTFVRSLAFRKRKPRKWISSGRATLLFSSFTKSRKRLWRNFRIELITR